MHKSYFLLKAVSCKHIHAVLSLKKKSNLEDTVNSLDEMEIESTHLIQTSFDEVESDSTRLIKKTKKNKTKKKRPDSRKA